MTLTMQRRRMIGGAVLLIGAGLWFALQFGAIMGWLERFDVVLRQAVVTGILVGSIFGLVAMGLTMIFGVLEIINFSHGALMTVGMYAAFLMYSQLNIDPYLSIFLNVPLLFVIGIIVYRLVIHPARDAPHHNQLLLTLGLSLLIENLLLVIFSATPNSIRLPYERGLVNFGLFAIEFPIRLWGVTIALPRLAAFIFAVLLTGVLYYILQFTDLGRAIRATAQDKDGAALVGINVDRISAITFGIGTACVGAAASLVLPFLAVDPVAGNTFNIASFVIVVLGGMGNVLGALLGGLIIGLAQEIFGVVFMGTPKLLSVFVIFILVLFFRPQGLLGRG